MHIPTRLSILLFFYLKKKTSFHFQTENKLRRKEGESKLKVTKPIYNNQPYITSIHSL